jgi:ATP-dependent DNA helicase RecQ
MSERHTRAAAEAHLQRILGSQVTFREGQWEAIDGLVNRHERMLVVQRTGWGKSLVYFMATQLLRAGGAGTTILISPLLSLMRNQVQAAQAFGLRAATLNSSNTPEHPDIIAALLAGQIDLLLISPERLANDDFQRGVWQTLRQRVGMLVIDEAHCISDWGHDFRPNYRRIMRVLEEIPAHTPVLGTTATANDRVVVDVAAIIGADMNIQRGSLTRESLSLYVYETPYDHATRLTLLDYLLRSIPGSGIIYCMTTRDCQMVAEWLQAQGHAVKPYYADVETETEESRSQLEQQLLSNKVKALVASVALGMGFDKPDLHFVIHYQMPGNIISYYQQIGRAGRGIDRAHIILMHGAGDEDIQRYFIDSAFPTREQVASVLDALAQHGSLSRPDLQRFVNARLSVLEKILTHLEVEGIVTKPDRHYQIARKGVQPDYARWAQVTANREAELDHMKGYLRHSGCLMRYLAQALDDPQPQERCGHCKNCTGSVSKFAPQTAHIETARRFLRGGKPILFEPRKRWVGDLTNIKRTTDLRVNEIGVVLCEYYDSGWSEAVRRGRFGAGGYNDELVAASADILREYWRTLRQPPQWVTSVPSLRRPALVATFAQRLAQALQLPYHAVVHHARQHPEQSAMQNSYQQALNVLNAFSIEGSVPNPPVLLIDDLVSSKWTLTVVGNLLQTNGSGAVHPFALATMTAGT